LSIFQTLRAGNGGFMVDFMVWFRTRTKLAPAFDDETQARGSCVSEKNFSDACSAHLCTTKVL
jgi:hypothetical protein